MAKGIYMDNAAATPIDPRVIRAINAALKITGNPSSFNDAGRRAQKVLESARTEVARFLNARTNEIIFCASGSEANTLAIMGTVRAQKSGHYRVLTTPIEHLSVLEAVKHSKHKGRNNSFVSVDSVGRVDVDDLMKQITPKTLLVSVMYVNNEIGTIQPIKKIARRIREWRKAHNSVYPYFHVDACQATAWLPMDVQALGVDLLTLNGAKAYGPHGSAVLFVRQGIKLEPQVLGGSQEYGVRAGSQDTAGIVGLAQALSSIKKGTVSQVGALRDYFLSKLMRVIPDAHINGPLGQDRIANNIHISIPGADSENLLLELDRHAIWAGSGSACTAHSVEPSHVLKAIGTPKKYLDGALRLSLSKHTTKADIDRVLKVLPQVISMARKCYLK